MKDQLIKILTHFGITATRFADEIGVQRSSISHILSGRNKPSYDFIIGVIEKYPELDPYWILTGKGNMLRNAAKEAQEERKRDAQIDENKQAEINVKKEMDLFAEVTGEVNNYKSKQINNITNVAELDRILLLFTDGTFIDYRKKE